MNTRRFIVVAALLLALAAFAAWLLAASSVKPEGLESGNYAGAPLTMEYRSDAYRFSLSMPEGFSATELPADEQGGVAVVLQDKESEGIQVYVVPAGTSAAVLTEADIRSAIPGIQIREPEVIEIGAEHRGLAFLSDNEAFGGDSREVWFYFRGNLYQISTYARLDSLLKAMFATWKFF